jgi:hypothetical protein
MRARRTVSINWNAWTGVLALDADASAPTESQWPLGALAAGALAATEAFKICMLKLHGGALNSEMFAAMFAPSIAATVNLAPADTPRASALGDFDIVSAGAITHATLFVLSRLPDVTGCGRVMDDDICDSSNLNRYALLRRTEIFAPKVDALASANLGSLKITGLRQRYSPADLLAPSLSGRVLTGVDDIPSRWHVQRTRPLWLGVGATTHWSAMASFHDSMLPCAQCLHPRDEPGDGKIPTVAFVSFWAGLLLAAYFARHLSGASPRANEQSVYATPMRPDSFRWMPVAQRLGCPTCGTWPGR